MERQHLVGQDLLSIQDSRSHTHTDTPDSSGQAINPTQRPLPYNRHHSQGTDIHATGGIRTRNPSKRMIAYSRLRPRGLRRTLQKRRSKIHVKTGGRTVRPSRYPALPWHHDHLSASTWNTTVYQYLGTPSSETAGPTLFCGWYNFKRRMSAANFQANRHTLL
jgi:hypothetical protein